MAIRESMARADRALELNRRLDRLLAELDAARAACVAGPTAGRLAELGEARSRVRRLRVEMDALRAGGGS